MTHTVTKCDQCGAIKGEGNRWLQAEHAEAGLLILVGDGEMDLCSEACLYKLISDFIAKIRAKQDSER